jgi:acyl-coenzyme A synthetase/AMP-(fatty) acid ligase/thioesterase domain-containing protein/acyl carrier protein
VLSSTGTPTSAAGTPRDQPSHTPSTPLSDHRGGPVADASVLDALTAVATRAPGALALQDDHGGLTHGELDRVTRALGVLLDERLTPDDHSGLGVEVEQGGTSVPVGVMVTHGVSSVLALLGLVRAGRIIVALDPFLPEARLRHVMTLAGIVDVVADAAHAAQASTLVADPTAVLAFESLVSEARTLADGDDDIPVVPAAAERGGRDALDIIFTSGSTGAPKGVVMTHRQAFVDTVAEREVFRLVPEDRIASVLPHGFSAGFSLLLSGLIAGASMHLADPRLVGVDGLASWIERSGLTTFHTTPHLVRSIVGSLDPSDDRLRGLRMVATVGEAVTGPDLLALRPLLGPTTSFFNWTGSSETNVYAVNEIAAGDPVPERSIPSGHIVAGKRVILRRPDGTTAEVGETGEIVCVSDAVTSGYWGAPDVTATRAGVVDGTPSWSVGDLGRFDEDGRITLLGRADDAVKVRGYLVEPSEVESALRTVDTVHEAAVVAVKAPPSPTRLVAYVVTRQGRRSASPAAIRKALRGMLPDYMVPTAIVPMSTLPRNERGKVDRAALPEAPSLAMTLGEDSASVPDADTYDQWELAVAQIWSEVLGLPSVGPLQLPSVGLDNDFAELGGDSLSAEEMLAKVHDRLGVDLPSSDLLEYPTVQTFAARARLGATAVPTHPDVMTLSDRSDGTPLFCVAGAGALALTFAPLTRQLDDRPVYAFQQHGLERRSVPDWSIPAMARRYIELMRVVQPRGPYTLAGHSFGGLVALEMASILATAGQEVRRVVLIDTFLPDQAAEQSNAVEFGELDLSNPADVAPTGLRAAVADRTEFLRERVLAPFGQIGRRTRAYGAGMFRWQGQQQFRAFFDHAVVVSRRHRPQVYAGPVTLVLADGNESGAERWAPFLSGRVDEVRVHAEHSSVLREPYVAGLAEAIREQLG